MGNPRTNMARGCLLTVLSLALVLHPVASDSGSSSGSSSGSGLDEYGFAASEFTASCNSYLDPHILDFAKTTNRRRASYDWADSFMEIGLFNLLEETGGSLSIQTLQAPGGWACRNTFNVNRRSDPSCPGVCSQSVNVAAAIQLASGAKLSITHLGYKVDTTGSGTWTDPNWVQQSSSSDSYSWSAGERSYTWSGVTYDFKWSGGTYSWTNTENLVTLGEGVTLTSKNVDMTYPARTRSWSRADTGATQTYSWDAKSYSWGYDILKTNDLAVRISTNSLTTTATGKMLSLRVVMKEDLYLNDRVSGLCNGIDSASSSPLSFNGRSANFESTSWAATIKANGWNTDGTVKSGVSPANCFTASSSRRDFGFDEFGEFDSPSRRTDSAETMCTQNGLDIEEARTDCVGTMQGEGQNGQMESCVSDWCALGGGTDVLQGYASEVVATQKLDAAAMGIYTSDDVSDSDVSDSSSSDNLWWIILLVGIIVVVLVAVVGVAVWYFHFRGEKSTHKGALTFAEATPGVDNPQPEKSEDIEMKAEAGAEPKSAI